jgi:hypothetical protein
MDENSILLAEQYVTKALRIVASQRDRVERLRGAGCDTLDAEQTLRVFEKSLRTFEDHRDWVRNHDAHGRYVHPPLPAAPDQQSARMLNYPLQSPANKRAMPRLLRESQGWGRAAKERETARPSGAEKADYPSTAAMSFIGLWRAYGRNTAANGLPLRW